MKILSGIAVLALAIGAFYLEQPCSDSPGL